METKRPVFEHTMPKADLDAEAIPLQMGSVILVEGQRYVIVSWDIKAASNGRSCSITSLDPWLAESARMKEIEHEQSERERMASIKKWARHLDEHTEEG